MSTMRTEIEDIVSGFYECEMNEMISILTNLKALISNVDQDTQG